MSTTPTMGKVARVVWAGTYNEELYQLITIFASVDLEERTQLPGPYARSLFFEENTVETLCDAIVKAEDAVMQTDVHGNETFQVASVLNKAERKHIFSKEFSPFYGPLVGLANITRDYAMKKEMAIDKDAYIFRPLKQHWSRVIRRLWDHPARSLGARNMFSKERYLVPYIFCRITEVESSFASVIDEESDLTIPLITRYWVHATEEEEIMQSSIFMILLIPRSPGPVAPPGGSLSPLYIIAEGEADTTVTILRRVLLNNDAIVEFVHATASHLRRFSGIEAKTVAAIMEKYWSWARANRNDPLCSEFLRVVRTSELFWRSLFEASSRSMGNRFIGSFQDTPHYYMSNLARCLAVSRDSTAEAIALTELWISTGIFGALEASLTEVLSCGTRDEQVELCTNLTRIYVALSFGPEKSPTIKSLISQQLPRPRTIRLLWDISQKLSGSVAEKVAPSHVCRIVVTGLELAYASPDSTCQRRGCEKTPTARCTRCKAGYCALQCQKRDWKVHKLVCGIDMDMEPAVRPEVERLTLLWMGGSNR